MSRALARGWLVALVVIAGPVNWPVLASGAPRGTAVVGVSPVDPDGALKPAYTVGHHVGGARCQRGSAMTGTAYRCFTPQSSGVLDPCWVMQTDASVICMTRPWQHRVIKVDVTGGYDDTDPFRPTSTPWGAQLASGNHCLFQPGSVNSVSGRPLRYYCHHHIVLVGRFDRSRQQWRVRTYRDVTPHAADSTYRWHGYAGVATAWFGSPSRED